MTPYNTHSSVRKLACLVYSQPVAAQVDGKAADGPDLTVKHFSGLTLPNPFVIGSGAVLSVFNGCVTGIHHPTYNSGSRFRHRACSRQTWGERCGDVAALKCVKVLQVRLEQTMQS